MDLPDARLAADEDERGGNEASPEHAIELRDAGRIRAASSARTSLSRSGVRAVPRPFLGVAWPVISSTSVPKAPQPGHFPSQRPVAAPHSEQTC